MTKEHKILAEYRLQRAKESYEDGEILLKDNRLKGALNRFYYAAFYSARSLLALKEVDSAKHSGVIYLFGQHFVKQGIFNTEISKVLSQSFGKRIATDYKDFAEINEGEVKMIKSSAGKFIKEAERVLKELTKNI